MNGRNTLNYYFFIYYISFPIPKMFRELRFKVFLSIICVSLSKKGHPVMFDIIK